jgi:hypothetical protein
MERYGRGEILRGARSVMIAVTRACPCSSPEPHGSIRLGTHQHFPVTELTVAPRWAPGSPFGCGEFDAMAINKDESLLGSERYHFVAVNR